MPTEAIWTAKHAIWQSHEWAKLYSYQIILPAMDIWIHLISAMSVSFDTLIYKLFCVKLLKEFHWFINFFCQVFEGVSLSHDQKGNQSLIFSWSSKLLLVTGDIGLKCIPCMFFYYLTSILASYVEHALLPSQSSIHQKTSFWLINPWHAFESCYFYWLLWEIRGSSQYKDVVLPV